MYTGLTGKVEIGTNNSATKIAYISNWNIEMTNEIIEVPELGRNTKHKKPGLQSWTASAEGTVVFAENSGQKELFEAMQDGKEVRCKFYLDYEQTPANPNRKDVYFDGRGFIESLSIELAAEDKGNIAITISGCGRLQFNQVPCGCNGANCDNCD